MSQGMTYQPSPKWRNVNRYLLAFFWCLGVICGIFLSCSVDDRSYSLIRSIPYGNISAISVLVHTVLPFLFSTFALCFNWSGLFLLICFCKAAFLSFLSFGYILINPSTGWILCCLFVFRNFLHLPLLYCFWLRCFEERRKFSFAVCLLWIGIAVLLESISLRFFMPNWVT